MDKKKKKKKRGEKETRESRRERAGGGGGRARARGSARSVSGWTDKIKISEMIPCLLLRLSREQNSSPSAGGVRRDKCDHPRWGIAGSSLPAHPRTEEKIKRNSTWADTPRKEEDGGTWHFLLRDGTSSGFPDLV